MQQSSSRDFLLSPQIKYESCLPQVLAPSPFSFHPQQHVSFSPICLLPSLLLLFLAVREGGALELLLLCSRQAQSETAATQVPPPYPIPVPLIVLCQPRSKCRVGEPACCHNQLLLSPAKPRCNNPGASLSLPPPLFLNELGKLWFSGGRGSKATASQAQKKTAVAAASGRFTQSVLAPRLAGNTQADQARRRNPLMLSSIDPGLSRAGAALQCSSLHPH